MYLVAAGFGLIGLVGLDGPHNADMSLADLLVRFSELRYTTEMRVTKDLEASQ